MRAERGVLVHEVVRGHRLSGRFADAAEHCRWWKAHTGGVALDGADGTDAAEPDEISELLVGEAMQAAILFERHEPRNCGQDGHLVNY